MTEYIWSIARWNMLRDCPHLGFIVKCWAQMLADGLVSDDEILLQEDYRVFVAVHSESKKPIGFLTIHPNTSDGKMWLSLAYVKPNWRRQGVMVDLLLEAKKVAMASSLRKVELATRCWNDKMAGVAEKCGFRPTWTIYVNDLRGRSDEP